MKRFKTKKRRDNKVIIFIFILLFFIIFVILSLQKLNVSHVNFIEYLLSKTSFIDKNNNYFFYKLTSNIDYLIKPQYFKDKESFVYKEEPLIYLYNTHDTEKYVDGTVVEASTLLKNNLQKLGIKSFVEEKEVSKELSTGLTYYNISRNYLLKAVNNNSFKYYVDIHRDSVTNTKVEINNKVYAKILFVLGLDNPYYEENKKIMMQMNKYLEENYPGLSKGILEKSGEGVDGVYNQDVSSNVILIEIGGIENNMEEVNNSTEIIALMFYNLLGE